MKASWNRWSLLGVVAAALSLTACRPDYPNCKEDSHCAEKGEVCAEGTCKQCIDDKGCKDGYVCKANTCVPGPECKVDSDCRGGLVCRSERCVPECADDSACGADQRCLDNKCVAKDQCASSSDCPAGQKCNVLNKCVADEKPTSTTTIEDESGSTNGGKSGAAAAAACSFDRIFFDFNEAAISESARETLSRNVSCLNGGQQSLTIEGHADERGTEEYNLVLSTKRANAAKRYMVNQGVKDARLKTVGFGEERPLENGHDESSWSRNRRADFVVR